MGKESIFMPMKYKRRFQCWDSEKVKAILMAMFEYQETGEVVALPPQYVDAFDAIRDDMDIINAAYEERCRKNAENGKKGGAPVGNQNARKTSETTERLKKQAKQPKQALREEKKRKEKKRDNTLINKREDRLSFAEFLK